MPPRLEVPLLSLSAASWADITHIKQVNYTNISQLLSRLSPNTSRVKPEQEERVTGKMVVFSWFIFTYTLLSVDIFGDKCQLTTQKVIER